MKRRELLLATGVVTNLQRVLPNQSASDVHPSPRSSSKEFALENRYMQLKCSSRTGLASLHLHSGRPLLENVTAAAMYPRGEVLLSDSRYLRQGRNEPSSLPGIEGETLVLHGRDAKKQLNMDWKITLLSDRAAAVFEVIVANAGDQGIQLRSSNPVRALLDENAGCYFSPRRVLTHGYMHHDPGGLMELGTPIRTFSSCFNVALRDRSGATLVVGFLDNRDGEGQITGWGDMTRAGPNRWWGFNLEARSLYNRYFFLSPNASISSGPLLLLLSDDPFPALELFGDLFGHVQHAKFGPIINGWCSWFYTQTETTEDEQIRNAEFIAKHLKRYGMEWVQVDDGYQKDFGDWEGNDRFPHGMKWLAGRIRELGLKPGLWISPNVVSSDSELAIRHPDWLIHDAHARLQVVPHGANARLTNALDVTHPGARKWLSDLFRTVRHDWGYEFIKIDFPGWTILAAERYFDQTTTKAQAYRLFWQTIRDAVGPDCHLLECGPGSVSAGLIDSMRIEQDSGLLYWQHYAKRFNSNAPAAAIRYYFHKRVWINDADHLGLALMTLEEAQAAASVIALSGGTMISGDRLTHLDATRLEILKKVLPSYGEAARPLDLFDSQFPEIFAMHVKKDFANWYVVGFFNWSERDPATREFELGRLGLRGSSFLCYDFWEQRLLKTSGTRVALGIGPKSVKLLAVRPFTAEPALLGTDRHFTQGGVELEEVYWEPARPALSGVALGGPGTSWTLAVHVPNGYVWAEKEPRHFRDHEGYSVVYREPELLRVRFDFSNAERVPWSLTFRKI